MLNKPSIVEHNNYRFMIFSAPDNNTIEYYLEVKNIYNYQQKFKEYKVTDVVRTCERTYTDDHIINKGIRIHDLRFDDGKFPNKEIIKSFINIMNDVFPIREKKQINENKCIAVHCIAGLGR